MGIVVPRSERGLNYVIGAILSEQWLISICIRFRHRDRCGKIETRVNGLSTIWLRRTCIAQPGRFYIRSRGAQLNRPTGVSLQQSIRTYLAAVYIKFAVALMAFELRLKRWVLTNR